MRIATLQFSPQVGQVQANVQQAESLLAKEETAGRLRNTDLLILPEMAFTGYNFTSLDAIRPYLEPTAAGLSTQWAIRTAKRLECTVAVGYPELAKASTRSPTEVTNQDLVLDGIPYNALVFVNSQGIVVAHTRKAFLYYVDDAWAQEGPEGFLKTTIPVGAACEEVEITAGICMDIQPYKFEAPITAYEFANHSLVAQVKLIILSMAWLTRLSHAEVFGLGDDETAAIQRAPDMDTVKFWLQRFSPLLNRDAGADEVIIVFANRAGEEGLVTRVGDVRYAGSSSVVSIGGRDANGDKQVRIWNMLGRGEDGVLIVDTTEAPRFRLVRTAD